MGSARQVNGLRKDGTQFLCEIALNPIAHDGQQCAVASITPLEAEDHATTERVLDGLQHWRSFLEQLGDTLWFWDLRTDRVEFSAAWLELMGYSPDELNTGDHWFSLVHPEDQLAVQAATANCIHGIVFRFEYEFRLRRKSGDFLWFQSSGQITDRSSDGNALHMLGLYRDTTQSRHARDALAASERRWNYALNGSGVGVWDWDLRTGEVYFSPEWKRMLGYSTDDLDPTIDTWRELALPEDLAASDAAIKRYIDGESDHYRIECRMLTKSGQLKWILDRGTIVETDADGSPVRMIGTHDDITLLKARETEAREAREQLERIASLVPGMVFQYKQWSDGRRKFPYSSKGIRDIFGLDPEDIANDTHRLFELFHPDDIDGIVSSINESRASLTQLVEEFRIILPNGTERWVHGVANPESQPADPQAVLWHGYISDITERKEAALALEQNARRVALANEDLEQFNYIAAHDLKEPLRAIGHLSEWIVEELPEDTAQSVHKNIERLQGRTNRLAELLEGLAAYSRAGRKDVVIELVNPFLLIRQLTNEIELRGCRIRVLGDEDQTFSTAKIALETVLRNLISNAVVHHDNPADGQIVVTVQRRSGHFAISIEDNGPGIEPKHHERIFRMYQRLYPELNKTGSGSGLSIIKRIINSLGSSIEIESPLTDRGTRFYFDWPTVWPSS